MAIQTTYPEQFSIGFEGQLADGASDRFARSYTNITVDMEYGRMVVQAPGDADNECSVPATGSIAALGVTMFTHATERTLLPDAGTFGIPVNKPANVLRRGRVVVVVEEAVTPASAVHFRHNAPGALPEAIGRWRTDVDGGDATLVANAKARFMTSAAAGEKAILEFDLS